MLQNDIFYNRQKSGYDELVSYQPKYYQNIFEMQAINQFGGLTTDKMAEDLEQLILDQFIDSCSVKMLNRFELFLGITGYENRSIAERRSIVKVNWLGNTKMNRTQIKALVRAYCGCDSEVHFTHKVMIIVKVPESNVSIYARDLLEAFHSKIPAHLKWTTNFEIDCSSVYNTNKVHLQEVQFRMTFSQAFRKIRYLDGTWMLDGSVEFSRYSIPLEIGIVMGAYKVKSNESATASSELTVQNFIQDKEYLKSVDIGMKFLFFDILFFDSNLELYENNRLRDYKIPMKTKLDLTVPTDTQECIDTSIILKKNFWCMDGAYSFDGTKELNAEIKEEVL